MYMYVHIQYIYIYMYVCMCVLCFVPWTFNYLCVFILHVFILLWVSVFIRLPFQFGVNLFRMVPLIVPPPPQSQQLNKLM
jgi:hypothetical protein